MKPKFRLFACVMAAVLCMMVFSVTAFASGGDYYESDESGEAMPPDSIDSITVNTEGVKLPENQGSEALTPDGNLSLIDDIQQSEPYAGDEGVTVGNKQLSPSRAKAATISISSLTAAATRKTCISSTLWMKPT